MLLPQISTMYRLYNDAKGLLHNTHFHSPVLIASPPSSCLGLDTAIKVTAMGYTRKAKERLNQLFCIHHDPDDLLSFGPVPQSAVSHGDHTLELARLYLRAVRVGSVIDGWLDVREEDREPHITAFAGFTEHVELWEPLDRFLSQWLEIVQHREVRALVWWERNGEVYDPDLDPGAGVLPCLDALREEVGAYEREVVGVLGRRLVELEGFKAVTLKKKIGMARDVVVRYYDPFTVPRRIGLPCVCGGRY